MDKTKDAEVGLFDLDSNMVWALLESVRNEVLSPGAGKELIARSVMTKDKPIQNGDSLTVEYELVFD